MSRFYVAIVSLAGLAACSQSPDLSTSSLESPRSSRAYAEAYIDLRHGALEPAEAKLRHLLSASDTMPSESYIKTSEYKRRAEYASGLAWVALERGDVLGAKAKFNEAIRHLAADEQAHIAEIRESDQKQQNLNTALSFGAIGLATAFDYKNVQAGTYDQSNSALKALDSSQLIAELSKPVDTTDTLVKFVGNSTTDTDGIRMIVIPALNGPLSVIGRVRFANSSCTGAMVGPRVVLTAAHCVTNQETGQRARESEVTFTIESANHKRTTEIIAIFTPTPVWRDGDFDNDWAVLQVKENPSASQDFLLADNSYNPGSKGTKWNKAFSNKLYLAGYSGDLNDGRFLTLTAGCSWLRVKTAVQGMQKCPSWKGSSGAPVLVKHGKAGLESYHVIGVNVWTELTHSPDARKGMRLITEEVAAAIRAASG